MRYPNLARKSQIAWFSFLQVHVLNIVDGVAEEARAQAAKFPH